ncbi:MAG: hypothetical protein IPL27_18020 [Lewinellaceae bacterium]|nr:hypothetical protein [Lewinellaceae bacterium]
MEDKDTELIERYYRHDLNESELADFERRLTDDVEFWEAVHLHADALAVIRMEGTALLRAGLAAKGRMLDAMAAEPKNRWRWFVVPIVLLLGALAWWWTSQKRASATVPPTEMRNFVAPPVSDTIPAATPATPPQTPAVTRHKTPDNQRIFATWFQPYKDASLEPARRGAAEPAPSERFQQLYWDGDYRSALAAFDLLDPSAQKNDNLLFLRANCLLANNQAEEAGILLETILRNDRSRFMAQASWYLALSRLQTGRRQAAEVLLRQIAADREAPRRADAQRVLRSL